MADFYISLSDEEIASQIAALVNANNQLLKTHNAASIRSSPAAYFIEVRGTAQVVGCAGLTKEYPGVSKIFHVCTHPAYRRQGIARKLVSLAMNNCKTENVYMTIREDNGPSLTMAASLGFQLIQRLWSADHGVMVVGRRLL